MLARSVGSSRLSMMILAAVALGVGGCDAPQQTVTPESVVDPEVAAVERQVQEHLAALAAMNAQGDPMRPERPDDEPVPEVVWSDPAWLAAHPPPVPPQPTRDREPAPKAVEVVEPEPVAEVAEPEVVEVEATPAPPVEPAPLDRAALIAKLLDAVRTSDDPAMDKAMAMVGLSLADPDRPLDETLLDPLTRSQRQQVRRYHELIVALGRQLAGGGQVDVDQFALQLDELFGKPLTIKTFALCRRVDGYGLYEPFPSNTFAAGKPLRLGLYVELDNFAVTQEAEHYVVKLSQEVTLFKDDLIVWREPVAEVVDRSRNRRRDFFTTQVIKLPANLGTGRYTLKLRVTDTIGNTLDETTQPIELVADPAMAGG